MNYSVTIDVPRLDEGLKFYCGALGLVEVARPVATYVILQCGRGQIGLIEKRAGSKPAKGSERRSLLWATLDAGSHRFPCRRF